MLTCSEYRSKIDPTTCIHYIKVGFSDRPFCDRDNMICILALPNREKCLVYVDKTKDTTVFEYHKFCMEYHIVRATFEYDDGEAVDYVYINDREFQLGQVGDCITNYTVP